MSVHYYSVRELSRPMALMTTQYIMSHDITHIATHPYKFDSHWIHRGTKGISKFLTPIEPWEYDMLDAFDIPTTTVEELLKPGTRR